MKFQLASAQIQVFIEGQGQGQVILPAFRALTFLPRPSLLSLLIPPVAPFCPLTHPVQAAQVLDFVQIGRGFIVDDSVLLVHTARLETQTRRWFYYPHSDYLCGLLKHTGYVKVCLAG